MEQEDCTCNDCAYRPCNDCGLSIFKGDELCGECYEKQLAAERWEAMHPETRCPPRE